VAFYGPAEGRCVGFCALALGTDAPELAMTPLDAQNLIQEVRWGSADWLALKCSSQGLVYFIKYFLSLRWWAHKGSNRGPAD
jgi:hypothetical protein